MKEAPEKPAGLCDFSETLQRRRVPCGNSVASIGEASSTLGASSFQNFSAVRGRHSFAEAVFLASLSFLGLIGPFHDLHLLRGNNDTGLSNAYSDKPYKSSLYYNRNFFFCQVFFSNNFLNEGFSRDSARVFLPDAARAEEKSLRARKFLRGRRKIALLS